MRKPLNEATHVKPWKYIRQSVIAPGVVKLHSPPAAPGQLSPGRRMVSFLKVDTLQADLKKVGSFTKKLFSSPTMY